MKINAICALLCLFFACPFFGSCQKTPVNYECITPEQAKHLMDTEENLIILDVRRQDEYDLGRIPGAILIPNEVISEQAEDKLKDKNQLILVYCRSGRRSKEAAQKLCELGYTNVKEFGGIIDWPYQITR